MMRRFYRHLAAMAPKLFLLFGWCAAATLFVRAALGPLGWQKGADLRAEVSRLEEENVQLSITLGALRRQITAESERPEVQAQLVRDLLGYVKPNEHVLRIDR